MDNTTLHISHILVTRPKLGRPLRSTQLVEVMVDTMMDTTVDVVVGAKVTTRSGETILGMGIEMIM